MPVGLYRDKDGWVIVATASAQVRIPRNAYETKGYAPQYDLLPNEEEYWAARKREL